MKLPTKVRKGIREYSKERSEVRSKTVVVIPTISTESIIYLPTFHPCHVLDYDTYPVLRYLPTSVP